MKALRPQDKSGRDRKTGLTGAKTLPQEHLQEPVLAK